MGREEIIDHFYSVSSYKYISDSKMWSTKFVPENYKRPIKLTFDLIDASSKKKLLNKGDKINFVLANK